MGIANGYSFLEAKKEILEKLNIDNLIVDELSNEEINDYISDDELHDTSFKTKDLIVVNNINALLEDDNFINLFANKYAVNHNKELTDKLNSLDSDLDWFKEDLNVLVNKEWKSNIVKWALNFQKGNYIVIHEETTIQKEDEEDSKKSNQNENQ